MRTALVLVALLLASCSTLTNDGLAAFQRGDCATARAFWTEAANKGDAAAVNNLGVAAENCDRNVEQAVHWYTLAARMGVPIAQNNLTRLGRPVPVADLARRPAEFNPAAAAIGLQLMQGNRPPPRPPVNCTTTHYVGQSVTQCH